MIEATIMRHRTVVFFFWRGATAPSQKKTCNFFSLVNNDLSVQQAYRTRLARDRSETKGVGGGVFMASVGFFLIGVDAQMGRNY